MGFGLDQACNLRSAVRFPATRWADKHDRNSCFRELQNVPCEAMEPFHNLGVFAEIHVRDSSVRLASRWPVNGHRAKADFHRDSLINHSTRTLDWPQGIQR